MRQLSTLLVIACPALGIAQISVTDALYRIEADAKSGLSTDTKKQFNPSTGAVQGAFYRVDAHASQNSSTVHSWATVDWNCTPFALSMELTACWFSLDNGDGNSGRMLSRLWLDINLPVDHIVSAQAMFDAPFSTIAFERWTGTTWTQIASGTQIQNYSSYWVAGDYRIKAQRLYNRTGNSTGCAPFAFNFQAQPVPEPGTLVALGTGAAVLLRKRRKQ